MLCYEPARRMDKIHAKIAGSDKPFLPTQPSFYKATPSISHYVIRTDREEASLNRIIAKKKERKICMGEKRS
jgi:hypothetical protein